MVGRDQAARADHVLDDDRRVAGDVLAPMSRQHPGVRVEPATGGGRPPLPPLVAPPLRCGGAPRHDWKRGTLDCGPRYTPMYACSMNAPSRAASRCSSIDMLIGS